MKNRILSILLTLSLLLGLLPTTALAAEPAQPFTDVEPQDWFSEAVTYVYEKGLMSGTTKTAFSPQSTTTRGMIVTILHRMEGCPAEESADFSDVADGAYYATAVAWAAKNNIVNGYDGTFAPNAPVTRAQLAAILYRYVRYKGRSVSAAGDLSAFRDAGKVAVYAREAMQWAVGAKLITGIDADTLDPASSTTRAQTAMILMRLCLLLEEKETSAPAADTSSNSGSSGGTSSGGSSSGGASSGGSSSGGSNDMAYNSYITDLTLSQDRKTLTAMLYAEKDAELFLRFLSEEDGEELFALKTSVKAKESAENEMKAWEVTVSITDELPTYFLIVGQLKDTAGNALNNPFTCTKYTKAYEDFQKKTPADFPDQIVLDFGQSESSGTLNFAVLNEDVKVLTGSDNKNILTARKDGAYTFENIDNQIKNFSRGDMLYFCTPEGEYILLKIDTITVDGSTAIITESSDVTFADFFRFFRLDMEVNVEQPEDSGTEAQTYSLQSVGRSRAAAMPGDKGFAGANAGRRDSANTTDRTKLSFSVKTDYVSVNIACSVSIHYKGEYDPEIFGEDYLTFAMSSTLEGGMDVSVGTDNKANSGDKKDDANKDDANKADKPKGEIVLCEIPIPVTECLTDSTLKLSIPYSIGDSVSAAFKINSSITSGFSYTTTDGYQKIEDKDIGVADLKLKGKLSADIGLALDVTLSTIGDILKASVGARAICTFAGTVQTGGDLTASTAESKHGCASCFDGSLSYNVGIPLKLSYKISDHLKGDVLNLELIGISVPLGSFYVSLVQDNWFPAGKVFYGFGKCPYTKYRVRFQTFNNRGNQVHNCPVTVTGTTLKGDQAVAASGNTVFFTYLSPGTYTATSTVEGSPVTCEFTVSAAENVQLRAPKAILTGQVCCGDKPINGASVTATDGETTVVALTGSDGMYSMELPNGTYTISFSASGYQTKLVTDQTITGDSSLSVQLGKNSTTGTLYFSITDGETLAPISGAAVVLQDSQGQTVCGIGLTNSAGQYTTEDLEEGTYQYTVTASDYANASGTITVVKGEEVPVSVQLAKETGGLSGTVMGKEGDTESVLAGAAVSVWKDGTEYDSTVTKADGTYELNLPLGTYTVKFSAQGYGATSSTVTIEPDNEEICNATLKKVLAGGQCGDKLYWYLTDEHVLTIYGEGEMWTRDIIVKNNSDWDLMRSSYSNTGKKAEALAVEEGTTSLGANAFADMSFKAVDLPSTLRKIDAGAFAGCGFSGNNYEITIPEGVTTIGGAAFRGCKSLHKIKLPSTLETIGEYAFKDCWYLESINLPNGLKSIGDEAFYGCGIQIGHYPITRYEGLKQITVPGVSELGVAVFDNCPALESVTFKSGITKLGYNTFGGTTRLNTIYIPLSVTEISYMVFCFDASRHIDIYYQGSEQDWENIKKTDGSGDGSGTSVSEVTLKIATYHYNADSIPTA